MEYKYGKNANYEDFSSGRVLYHIKGMTNFPVRLAQEIYGRCLEYSPKKREITLYDPCCGGGYLLTVLGFLNQDTLGTIIGSDINPELLSIARKNLSLLRTEGIEKRTEEIQEMMDLYQKPSHGEAQGSALKLMTLLKRELVTQVFQADVLQGIPLTIQPDVIITDVPYGQLVQWQGAEENFTRRLLENLAKICTPQTIIGLCTNKKQKVQIDGFSRLERQQIGKRQFIILRKN
ncbi:MAG: hypothetical protein ACOYD6_08465 [Limnochordia bacterium]|jgi:tRNA G10  N-methylase Trm11